MPPKKDEEKLNRALCRPGNKVFYWEPKHGWAIGTVLKDSGKTFDVEGLPDTALLAATKVDALKTCKVNDEQIWPVRDDVLDETPHDLLSLTELHNATIQRCLYLRYMNNTVYTNIGAIVVALNPWNFKIPYYMDAKMPDYLDEGARIKENLPHSWAQAHNTWHELREQEADQCILISGESGAGKTEAAKIVMKYLGTLSCMRGEEEQKNAAKQIAFNINQASPILEAFGNAKTVRNDNSSRFGKFVKVQFDAQGFLSGAFTIKYLLEKSRIITAATNERVYHSFYLLLKGKDAARYGLGSPSDYHTNAGQCIDIPKVDDGEDYSICLDAMNNCQFPDEDQQGVWCAVAGICHILRVGFKAVDQDNCRLEPSTEQLVPEVCKWWMVDSAVMTQELVHLTRTIKGEPVTTGLSTVRAADGRDALVKTLYDNLFGWQVDTINKLTDTGMGKNFIGLLDIFGFEDFEYNSFEQICINLANETLQNHYNNYIFTKDMDECRAEGVDVTSVKCPDNSGCLKMMTAKTGIFKLLDDECLMDGTDRGFLDKVKDGWKSCEYFAEKRLSKNSFIVRHYAAEVEYTVENWLDKNRDTLKPAWKAMMRASDQGLIKTLIAEHDESAKPVTVGGFFKQQLILLMELINTTNPHWIRCVKPHPAKKPLMLYGITCMEQLESSGVLGTVKIRKAGFPVRPTFQKFVARFKSIMPQPYPKIDGPEEELKAFCRRICDLCEIEPLRAQPGRTKMFLKNDASQKLEAMLDECNRRNIAIVQRYARYNISLSLRAYKYTVQRFQTASRTLQAELREWLLRSAAVRQQREEMRRVREEALKAVSAIRQVAADRLRAALQSCSWEVPSTVRPTDEAQEARIDAAVSKMRGNPSSPVPPPAPHAVPSLPSRQEGEDYAMALAKQWYGKSGDVLDELLDNLKGPEEEGESLSTLSVLSEVCFQLRSRAAAAGSSAGLVSALVMALQTMRPADIDRALCFSDAPEYPSLDWGAYRERNGCVMSQLQGAASPGSPAFGKWTKTMALLGALSGPLGGGGGGLVRHATLAADQIQQLRQAVGKPLLWQAPCLCSDPAAPAPPDANVRFVLSGVGEGLSLDSVSQHPAGPCTLLPPLSAFQVVSVEAEGSTTLVRLQGRGQLTATDQVLKELKDCALMDAEVADARLEKVRAKLMERKIEAEKERQRLLAELLRDKLAELTGPLEGAGREEVEQAEQAARQQLLWVGSAQAALYHEYVLLWCEEEEATARGYMHGREERARRGLAAYLCAREATVGLADTEAEDAADRSLISRCEELCRAELLKRRRLLVKCDAAGSLLRADVAVGLDELRRRVGLRLVAMRRRDLEVRRLQHLLDDEVARVSARNGALQREWAVGSAAGASGAATAPPAAAPLPPPTLVATHAAPLPPPTPTPSLPAHGYGTSGLPMERLHDPEPVRRAAMEAGYDPSNPYARCLWPAASAPPPVPTPSRAGASVHSSPAPSQRRPRPFR